MIPFEPGKQAPLANSQDETLDRMLSQFFKQEIPSPWPVLPMSTAKSIALRRSVQPRRRTALFALAASFLLLIAGQYCLSSLYSTHIRNRLASGEARHEAINRAGRFRSQQVPSDEFRDARDIGILSGKR